MREWHPVLRGKELVEPCRDALSALAQEIPIPVHHQQFRIRGNALGFEHVTAAPLQDYRESGQNLPLWYSCSTCSLMSPARMDVKDLAKELYR